MAGRCLSWKPGQFVSVRAYLPEVKLVQPRQYSLSAAPEDRSQLRISVKRIAAAGDAPAGLMSNHLHKCLKAGDTIDVSAPAGEFHLAEEYESGVPRRSRHRRHSDFRHARIDRTKHARASGDLRSGCPHGV